MLFALALAAFLASIDEYGVGSGRDGNYVARGGENIVNDYLLLSDSAAVGAGARIPLRVNTTKNVGPGSLVMFLQTRDGNAPSTSGDQAGVDVRDKGVGGFELARVAAVGIDWILLTQPLQRAFAAVDTQIVSVPEYAAMTVPSGARVTARPWDGSTGGVVAFLVRGPLRNDGSIDVSGLGFRGGQATTSWVFTLPGREIRGCTSLDGPPDPGGDAIPGGEIGVGGARKGEGITNGDLHGRGNLANGAGGGNCHNAGGGGGGGYGGGGKGNSWSGDERDTGGLPGVGIVRTPLMQLVFGGGGGAGEENNGPDPQMPGANGGGSVWIRAGSYLGNGSILANGADREGKQPPFNDGEGGGGGGGSILLRTAERSPCPAALSARGGNGGNTQNNHGPGGGGGGGAVLAHVGDGVICQADVAGGIGGVDIPITTRSAEAGAPGVVAQPPIRTLPVRIPSFSEAVPCEGSVQGTLVSLGVSGAPDTLVRVQAGQAVVCERLLDQNGNAECSASLGLGKHPLTARTIGDADQGGIVSASSAVCEIEVVPECAVDYGAVGQSCPVDRPMCFDQVCGRCYVDSDCQNRVAAVCNVASGRCVAAPKVQYALRGGTCQAGDGVSFAWIVAAAALLWRKR